MPERILVVDDDRQLTSFLERFLSKQGYSVSSAGSATQMGLMMEHRDVDLIILDVGLPDIDGFEVVRQLRKSSRIPIVLLTVRGEVYDKIIGLEMGADDYLAKPFEPRELLARIRAVLRRSQRKEDNGPPARKHEFSGFEIDLETRSVKDPEKRKMPLTSTEYTLLVALVERAGSVAHRVQLMEILYGDSVHVTDRAIDAHIARLRRKIIEGGGDEALIKTVHGAGYSLASTVKSE